MRLQRGRDIGDWELVRKTPTPNRPSSNYPPVASILRFRNSPKFPLVLPNRRSRGQ